MSVIRKRIARLYLQEGKRTTEVILAHIAKHSDALFSQFKIEQIYVRKHNEMSIRQIGIKQTPTLVVNMGKTDASFTSTPEILHILTPAAEIKDNSRMTPDEMTSNYFSAVMSQDEDVNQDDLNEAVLRQRMAEMQKRREPMQGVDKKNMIEGGRTARPKVKPGTIKSAFSSDADFISSSGMDDFDPTPTYDTDFDGELFLEEHRNELADQEGRKANNKPIRWSAH